MAEIPPPDGGHIYPRFVERPLKRHLRSFPVVLLIGPRQSGKTTETRRLGQERAMSYASFDDIGALANVRLDPTGFLSRLNKPLVLDEVQRAPEIFLPIKVDVDLNRHAGRYLLTGSANPLLVPNLGDSLTGRMGICNMWPLSQAELAGSEESFIDRLFSSADFVGDYEMCGQEQLIQKCELGGFPELLTLPSPQSRRDWCNNYLSLAIQKDIKDLSQIEGFLHLPVLMQGLAARVGSTINIEELSRMIRTPATSVRRHLQLLENLFLLYRLPAWSPNQDKRLVKSPKVYYSDTALLLSVIGLTTSQLTANPNMLGHIVENLVVMECVKQATWSETPVKMYHYRNEQEHGSEVDLVFEAAGEITGVEIKLSSIVRSNDLKGLKSLRQTAGNAFRRGVILYTGDKVLSLGEGLLALPISALWKG